MTVQEPELVELLSDLIRIDSVTPWLIPGAAGEADIARFIADWLTDIGVDVIVEEVVPGRPNVVGRVPGAGSGRSVILNQHTDTVGYGNSADRALHPERRSDRTIGIGEAADK